MILPTILLPISHAVSILSTLGPSLRSERRKCREVRLIPEELSRPEPVSFAAKGLSYKLGRLRWNGDCRESESFKVPGDVESTENGEYPDNWLSMEKGVFSGELPPDRLEDSLTTAIGFVSHSFCEKHIPNMSELRFQRKRKQFRNKVEILEKRVDIQWWNFFTQKPCLYLVLQSMKFNLKKRITFLMGGIKEWTSREFANLHKDISFGSTNLFDSKPFIYLQPGMCPVNTLHRNSKANRSVSKEDSHRSFHVESSTRFFGNLTGWSDRKILCELP